MSEIDIHEEIKKRLKGPEPLPSVDATPDDDYPIRILEAFLHNTGLRWELTNCDERLHQIYDAMNEAQEKRAEILRQAITTLKFGHFRKERL